MTWCMFLSELALVKAALESLKALLLFLQKRDATAFKANSDVTTVVTALRFVRFTNSMNTKCLKEELDNMHTFKVINIWQVGKEINMYLVTALLSPWQQGAG